MQFNKTLLLTNDDIFLQIIHLSFKQKTEVHASIDKEDLIKQLNYCDGNLILNINYPLKPVSSLLDTLAAQDIPNLNVHAYTCLITPDIKAMLDQYPFISSVTESMAELRRIATSKEKIIATTYNGALC